MPRAQNIVNMVALLLLIIIASGFLIMPRYNYGVLTSRIGVLEGKANSLESGFEKLNILAGPGEEKRAAVVANINVIADNLKKLEAEMASYLEVFAQQGTQLEKHSLRIKKLEDLFQSMTDLPNLAGSPGEDRSSIRTAVAKALNALDNWQL